MRRFDLDQFLYCIQAYGVSEVVLPPPVAMAIVKHPQISRYSFPHLRLATCSTAPLSKEHQTSLQKVLGPQVSVCQVWGMTETSCIASRFFPGERDDTGSVGRMLANLDVK